MKINTTKYAIVLGFSILLNIILCIMLFLRYFHNSPSESQDIDQKEILADIQNKAEAYVRKVVCDNLFYPNSYDPVKTIVDSIFYCPLTDAKCVKAASELIDLRDQYSSAQQDYNHAVDQIRFFGRTDMGMSHWGKDRDKAKAKMKELQEKIDRRQSIIKNRDSSMDGKYFGWQIFHRYRASNSDGVVSFGDVLFVMDKNMNKSYFRYSLDDNDRTNLKSIKETIEKELGTYYDL